MNLLRRFFCFAVAILTGSFAHAATPLNNVVSDRDAAIVSLHDVPAIIAGWNKSPWAKTWNDDQVKKYFAPMRSQMKIDDWDATLKQKTGYTLTDLLGFATGDAIVAIPNFDFSENMADKPLPILLGIDVGDNATKLEALFAKGVKEENATEETSEFAGVAVHVIHPAVKEKDKENEHPTPPMVWAVVDGKWFLSPSKDAILAAIDAVHNGGVDNAWGRSERWARLAKETGEAQIIFSLNVEAIYPTIKTALDAKLKSGPTASGPFAVDAETLLSALGLDTWREFYLTANLGDDATDVHGGLSYSGERGLTKLAAYHDGPVATPNFVSAKCVSVSTNKISVKEAYAALEEMLGAISPAVGGIVQGQVRSLNKQLGIDLKRDFIGSLGDTVIIARMPSNDSGNAVALADLDQFFAFSLQNPDTFSKAVDSFHRMMGEQADQFFKTRDFLGFKITTFSPGDANRTGTKPFHYAIAKGYFFFSMGSATPIEAALRGLAQDQETIWTQKDVAAAFAQVPANASAFEYEDVGQLVNSFFKTLSTTSSLLNTQKSKRAIPPADDAGPPEKTADSEADTPPEPIKTPDQQPMVDVSSQPDPATIAKYWSYGWGYVIHDSSGIRTTSKIVYPK